MFSDSVVEAIGGYLGFNKKTDAPIPKNEILKFLGIGMGGILLAIQAVPSYMRAKAMEDAAKAQAGATAEQAEANRNAEKGLRQERLKNAIEHLGHVSDSVRLGGAYELFHLADEIKELRERLELHIGMPESRELPQNSGAITRAYTAEEAEEWIAEYEKTTS